MAKSTKQLLATLHRYLGLSLLGFFLVLSFTGFSLVFQHEWDAVINPDLYAVEWKNSQPVAVDALVESVETSLPEAYITHLPLVQSVKRAQVIYVAAKSDPVTGEEYEIAYDEAFLDSSSGRVNGTRQWGQCCGRENVLPMLYKLHNRLLLPSGIGHTILAVLAVSWLALSVIGAYLVLSNRRINLTWRKGLKGRAAKLQLHRQLGFWSLPFALVTIVSGLSIVLEDELTKPVVSLFSTTVNSSNAEARVVSREKNISYGRAVEIAVSAVSETELIPTAVDYSASKNQYAVELKKDQVLTLAPQTVYLSAADGAVLGMSQLEGAANRILDNRILLHSGSMFGLVGRVLVATMALLLFTMSVTGFMMWRQRRSR